MFDHQKLRIPDFADFSSKYISIIKRHRDFSKWRSNDINMISVYKLENYTHCPNDTLNVADLQLSKRPILSFNIYLIEPSDQWHTKSLIWSPFISPVSSLPSLQNVLSSFTKRALPKLNNANSPVKSWWHIILKPSTNFPKIKLKECTVSS